MRSVLTFAVVLLVAASAIGQVGRIPSHMVSASTNALDNLGWGGTGTVAEVLEWIDSNWPTNIDPDVVYTPTGSVGGLATAAVSALWPNLDTNSTDDLTVSAASNMYLAATSVVGNASVADGVLTIGAGLQLVDQLEARCGVWTNTSGAGALTLSLSALPWSVTMDYSTGYLSWASGTLTVPAGTDYVVQVYAMGAVYNGTTNVVNALNLNVTYTSGGSTYEAAVAGIYDKAGGAAKNNGVSSGVMYCPTSRPAGATYELSLWSDIGGTAANGLWVWPDRLGAVLFRRQ